MKKETLTTRISAGAKALLNECKRKTGLTKEAIIERSIKAHAIELVRKLKP